MLRSTANQPYFDALLRDLRAFGVPLEGLHTETGPGVLEAAILYSDALEAADRAVLFKTAVREIAGRFGILATFMARWSTDLPGCGGHAHQSLWDLDHTINVFHDPADQTAQWIGQFRWNSTFWRVFDWTMLTLVLFHSFMGVRIVIGDLLGGAAQRIALIALYVLAAALFLMGIYVVITLPNVVPA